MENFETRIKSLPLWKGEIWISPLSGGLSNAGFKVQVDEDAFVVRFGQDFPFHQVSRAREAAASKAAFEVGLSPELIYAQNDVSVFRFIKAKTYTEPDVTQNWQACLELIKRCHAEMGKSIKGQGAIFWAFQIIRDYAETLTKHNHAQAPNLPRFLQLSDQLEAQQIPLPIIFGHHDLLPANFLDDGKRLFLIDWEYAAFGTCLFDLANLASANSFSHQLELQMLESYFEATPTETLIRAFSAMKVAAALREALWAMISEVFLSAPGADYSTYTADNLARFDVILKSHEENFGAVIRRSAPQ